MEILIGWLIGCFLVAMLASRNDREPVGAFMLALFLSPVLVGIAFLVMGKSEEARMLEIRKDEEYRFLIRQQMAEADHIEVR